MKILKSIVSGILLGGVLFFTGPLIPIVLLLKFIFTPFGMGRMNRFGRGFNRPAFAGSGFNGGKGFGFTDKIRNMSEEDYTAFKLKFEEKMQGKSCRG